MCSRKTTVNYVNYVNYALDKLMILILGVNMVKAFKADTTILLYFGLFLIPLTNVNEVLKCSSFNVRFTF